MDKWWDKMGGFSYIMADPDSSNAPMNNKYNIL